MPMLPVTPAARSLRMSPNRLLATITSNDSGRRTSFAARASTCSSTSSTSGCSAARSRTTSSQNGMRVDQPVGLRRRRQTAARGRRPAKRVVGDPADATPGEDRLLDGGLLGQPSVEPAADLAVLALVVLADDHQVDRPVVRRRPAGSVTPSNERTGRRLTYCSNARRIGISRPHSETWSGTPGRPTAPSRTASYSRKGVQPVGRHHRALGEVALAGPVELVDPQSQAVALVERPSTVRAEAATSTPMPSPGMRAMRRPGVVSTSRRSGRRRHGDVLRLEELLDADGGRPRGRARSASRRRTAPRGWRRCPG